MKEKLAYRLINKDEESDLEVQNYINKGLKMPFEEEIPVSLYKRGSNEIQFMSEGQFKPILIGYDYLLIKENIAQLLNELAKNLIELNPVRIFRRKTSEEWLDYYEITIRDEITYENYKNFTCQGIQVFHLGNSFIYVSPDLKTKMELNNDKDLNIKYCQDLPQRIGETKPD